MNKTDIDNTGYTIQRTTLEKTEGAIKYGQSRHRQHRVYNTHNKG